MIENFPKLMSDANTQIQETQENTKWEKFKKEEKDI